MTTLHTSCESDKTDRAKSQPKPPHPDLKEVRRAIGILADPQHAIELRGLPSGQSYILPAVDVDDLCQAARQLSGSGNVYYTINPVPAGPPRAAKDADVIARRWVLLDIDPVRPADSCSTDAEKDTAKDLAYRVMDHLDGMGWPLPLIVDSGSGWHLLFRVDLPNDEAAKRLVQRLLKTLASLNTEQAKVDTSVYNASRISRLPGTWNRKGDDTEDRPHRLCRLYHVPDELIPVPLGLLEQAAGTEGDARQHKPKATPSPFTSLRATSGGWEDRSKAYARAALAKEIARIKMASVGERNNALNRAAFSLAQLVAGGCLDRLEVEQALLEVATHVGLDEREARRTIQSGCEAGGQKPRTPPEKNGHQQQSTGATPNGDGAQEQAAVQPRFKFISSAEFARTDYRQEWLVKRLLVKGQPGIFGGPKKSLKTSLLADLAISLGTGTKFLNHFDVYRKTRVAVMSGESGQATLQDTAQRVCRAKDVRLQDADVLWEFELPQLARGTDLAALKDAIVQEQIEVLIIDPLYLCILSGLPTQGNAAANVFVMGPLYANVAQTCLSVGCTPALAHHFKLSRQDAYAEPQLEDLAYAGVQEFARQWMLVGRREKYQPGTGSHQLWLTVGGSAGQSGLWSLDVEEGVMDEDFGGRQWGVTVTSSTEVMKAAGLEKAEERRQQDRDDDSSLMNALDRLDPDRRGCGCRKLLDESGLSRARMQRAVTRLKKDGLIEEVPVAVRVGNGAERQADGLRRVRDDEE